MTPVPSITDDQLAEIEALARDAVPGPWKHEVDEDSCYGATFVMLDTGAYSPPLCRIDDEATAEFVAVTNPATILAMIARIRELERAAISR